MARAERNIDWERVEAQYRVGTMSLREIAGGHGITEGAVRKRAKRDSWARDLGARVRAKADALVRKEMVRSEVRTENPSETLTVEVEAQVQARIRLSHRTDIAKCRKLLMSQLAELEGQTDNIDLVRKVGELLSSDARDPDKINAVYQKAVSLGSRASTMKSLAESLRILVGLERQALSLDEAEGKPEKSLAERIKALSDQEAPPHAALPAYCDLGSPRLTGRPGPNGIGL